MINYQHRRELISKRFEAYGMRVLLGYRNYEAVNPITGEYDPGSLQGIYVHAMQSMIRNPDAPEERVQGWLVAAEKADGSSLTRAPEPGDTLQIGNDASAIYKVTPFQPGEEVLYYEVMLEG